MTQPAAPHAAPSFLLRLDELQLQAIDGILQAHAADLQHPILSDWTDVLIPLHGKVTDLLGHPNPGKSTPR